MVHWEAVVQQPLGSQEKRSGKKKQSAHAPGPDNQPLHRDSQASYSRPGPTRESDPTMPEQMELKPPLTDHKCNAPDVLQRISLASPPVNLSMYKTLYMIDYKPFSIYRDEPLAHKMDDTEQLKLDAQLRAKEFARPTEPEPMKYAEDPCCQEIKQPYTTQVEGKCPRIQEIPPSYQQVLGQQERCFNQINSIPARFAEPTINQEREVERMPLASDPCAFQGSTGTPGVKKDEGQNWANYEQYILESRRAATAKIREIKRVHLGSSIFQDDLNAPTEGSTYQSDFKYWPSVRSDFCRANRNFSSLVFDDHYYPKNPWMSEYMDNYSVFLRRLNWKSRSPAYCSNPTSLPSQTPIAVNAAH